MRRVLAWYDYRIVNVNVNVLLAGVIALAITVGVMHALEVSKLLAQMSAWVDGQGLRLWGYELQASKLLVTGLTFVVDLVADVVVYYVLHWVANHTPRRKRRRKTHAYADLSFMRDATLVQFERALLSPVLYVIALSLQNKLLHEGASVAWATGFGFAVGLVITRLLHTLWMIRAERRAGKRSAADVVGPDRAVAGAGDAPGGPADAARKAG
ncbi:MAG: hypothetical protein SFZ24_06225 [Planctomycetota bacterium]|nr:hypothetical protein [Planctomycetota bacterium]